MYVAKNVESSRQRSLERLLYSSYMAYTEYSPAMLKTLILVNTERMRNRKLYCNDMTWQNNKNILLLPIYIRSDKILWAK